MSNIKHRMTGSRTYRSWQAMKNRCYRAQDKEYARYGAAGVTVCAQWRKSFLAFVADMGVRPPGKSLDRLPNHAGNYTTLNCRWATPAEQARNTRRARHLTFRGVTMTIKEWERALGMKATKLNKRLYAGWSVRRALTEGVTTPA